MEKRNNISRRKFIQQTAVAGTGLMLAGTINLSAQKSE